MGLTGLTAPALLGWGHSACDCVCLECVCVGRSPLKDRLQRLCGSVPVERSACPGVEILCYNVTRVSSNIEIREPLFSVALERFRQHPDAAGRRGDFCRRPKSSQRKNTSLPLITHATQTRDEAPGG